MVHTDRLKPCVTGERIKPFKFGTNPGGIKEEEQNSGEFYVEGFLAHLFVRERPEFTPIGDVSLQGRKHLVVENHVCLFGH
jgi:hypothetical protein